MRLLLLILLYLIDASKSTPSSELIYTDQACSNDERVSVTNTANSASECETACYNRYLSSGDCFFYSFYSSEVLCEMFSTCNNVVVAGTATTYEMTVLSDAPTSAPTKNPTNECECLNGGICVNEVCFCKYPYFGTNCESQKDCSLCI